LDVPDRVRRGLETSQSPDYNRRGRGGVSPRDDAVPYDSRPYGSKPYGSGPYEGRSYDGRSNGGGRYDSSGSDGERRKEGGKAEEFTWVRGSGKEKAEEEEEGGGVLGLDVEEEEDEDQGADEGQGSEGFWGGEEAEEAEEAEETENSWKDSAAREKRADESLGLLPRAAAAESSVAEGFVVGSTQPEASTRGLRGELRRDLKEAAVDAHGDLNAVVASLIARKEVVRGIRVFQWALHAPFFSPSASPPLLSALLLSAAAQGKTRHILPLLSSALPQGVFPSRPAFEGVIRSLLLAAKRAEEWKWDGGGRGKRMREEVERLEESAWEVYGTMTGMGGKTESSAMATDSTLNLPSGEATQAALPGEIYPSSPQSPKPLSDSTSSPPSSQLLYELFEVFSRPSARGRHVSKLEHLLEDLGSLGAPVTPLMLSRLAQQLACLGDIDKVDALLVQMRLAKLPIPAPALESAVIACARAYHSHGPLGQQDNFVTGRGEVFGVLTGLPERAAQGVKEVEEAGFRPSQEVLVALMEVLSKAQRHREAVSVWPKVVDAAEAAAAAGSAERFSAGADRQARPSLRAYNVYVEALSGAGEVAAAERVVREMGERGMGPLTKGYNAVLRMHVRRGVAGEADGAESPAGGAGGAGEGAGAVVVAVAAVSASVLPATAAAPPAAAAAAARDAAVRLFSEMASFGCPASVEACNLRLHTHLLAHDWKGAWELYGGMQGAWVDEEGGRGATEEWGSEEEEEEEEEEESEEDREGEEGEDEDEHEDLTAKATEARLLLPALSPPNQRTYDLLLLALGQAGDVRGLERVYEAMLQEGVRGVVRGGEAEGEESEEEDDESEEVEESQGDEEAGSKRGGGRVRGEEGSERESGGAGRARRFSLQGGVREVVEGLLGGDRVRRDEAWAAAVAARGGGAGGAGGAGAGGSRGWETALPGDGDVAMGMGMGLRLSREQRQVLVGALLGGAEVESADGGVTHSVRFSQPIRAGEEWRLLVLDSLYELFLPWVAAPPVDVTVGDVTVGGKEARGGEVGVTVGGEEGEGEGVGKGGDGGGDREVIEGREAEGASALHTAPFQLRTFATIAHPSLQFYARQFRSLVGSRDMAGKQGGGQAVIPRLIHRWLSPRGMAAWFMYNGWAITGDGGAGGRGGGEGGGEGAGVEKTSEKVKKSGENKGDGYSLVFGAEGYSAKEVALVVAVVGARVEDCAWKKGARGEKNAMRFSGRSAQVLWRAMEPYMVEGARDALGPQ
ncbi:hypothetical protein CLOP_g12585, partial [Closterium sp. NIES-67]